MQSLHEKRREGIPRELQQALDASPASTRLSAYGAKRAQEPGHSGPLEIATIGDLGAILQIVSLYPDNAPQAKNKGFLRGRFSPQEYEQLVEDGCVRVIRENDKTAGFISVIPWSHSLIGPERMVTGLRIGPIGCHWTKDDYSTVVKRGNISYIAEAAAHPSAPHAGAQLIRGLMQLRTENPENYLVTTCSEAPVVNLHSASLVQSLGFERIGFVWLPLRPMSVGPYPGKIRLVTPFQSGIWCMKPLNSGV